jgi:hypothetical protein
MADQTTITRPHGQNGAARSVTDEQPAAGKGVYRNVRHLGRDFVNLAELQFKLLSVDLKDVKGHALGPALGIGIGLVVLLATLPVAMIAAAHLLIDFAGWPPAAAYGLAAAVGLVIGGVLLFVCAKRIATSFSALHRSRQEFIKNLDWIKTVLSEGGGVRSWTTAHETFYASDRKPR